MPADASARRPNIVIVLADDLGYGDVSCLNPDSKIHTPHHDRIAREGMAFTDGHSSSAVCTPSRYSIVTGRYCWRTRLKQGVLWGYSPPLVEEGRTTIATLLKQAGYATACIGKWHLGLGWATEPGVELDDAMRIDVEGIRFDEPLSAGPHTCGFDESFVLPASLDMPPYCFIHNGVVTEAPTARCEDSPLPPFFRGGRMSPGFEHRNCLLELTRRAEAYIDHHATASPDQPFLLYFPTTTPHTPHMPREPFVGKSKAGPYGDTVVEHDWSLGRILAALDRNGIADNTLVIVTSDNGCHTGPPKLEERYQHRGNYIFRGQKSDVWDGGHRIPLLMRWPGRVAAGSTCNHTACLTDLLATFADIVGRPIPQSEGQDSVSILPLLEGGETPPREATVHHSYSGMFAIRSGKWKLLLCRGSGGWSLSEKDAGPDAPPVQLYDMDADPTEQHNLCHEHADVVEKLTALLDGQREVRG